MEIIFQKICKDFYTPNYKFSNYELIRLLLIISDRGFEQSNKPLKEYTTENDKETKI